MVNKPRGRQVRRQGGACQREGHRGDVYMYALGPALSCAAAGEAETVPEAGRVARWTRKRSK